MIMMIVMDFLAEKHKKDRYLPSVSTKTKLKLSSHIVFQRRKATLDFIWSISDRRKEGS